MSKVSNEVLLERIESIRSLIQEHTSLDAQNFKELKEESKLNTEFRNKWIGTVSIVGGISSFIGAAFLFVLGKIWK